ncbi:MAG: type II toxin-antitoxin system RelE/ParE family toxin [Acidobacteriia bacterium]|nr:type II toxin-antitoxin system RelE/ParE family toxin [Terriglobia bacterium]
MYAGKSQGLKRVIWVGSSKKDLLQLPARVVDVFGYALFLAQTGGKHAQAKPLKGFGSAGVLEIVEDWEGNSYRAVYTVRLPGHVFVLHAFQKKSKRGASTPGKDLDLIRKRWKVAEELTKEMKA